MQAWLKRKPPHHTSEQVMMFCMCAVGGCLESDTSGEQGHLDPIALAVYLLAVLIGKEKPTVELALSHSCMGAVLFHIGMTQPPDPAVALAILTVLP